MANPIALRETLAVLNEMESAGVIGRYAICGAVAAFRHIEAFMTLDLDISVFLPGVSHGLVTLSPIMDFLSRTSRPAVWRGEGLVIGRWPVQFLVAADPLDDAALQAAETVDVDGVETRFWAMEYLMAKCVQVGRPKDHARLVQFLEQPFDSKRFCAILHAFELGERFAGFCRRFELENVCATDP